MAQSFAMNGGDGVYSYTKNSILQRKAAGAMEEAIKEAVVDNLDVGELLSGPGFKTFTIADLGCSTGPNTFFAVQTLIDAVQQKYGPGGLEFHVSFNDRIDNDFNTLFASLPNPRGYLAAGVPGSFHGRLFPSASVHIAYSAIAIHWLSKEPEGLQVRNSPAWNAGRINYTGAPEAVMRAYLDQFEEDMGVFLRARAQEIVHGGLCVILVPGVPRRGVEYRPCVMLTFLESVLMDMVKEGVLEQEKVDTFNIATLYPSIEEMKGVVEENGCFEIVKMEMIEIKLNPDPEAAIIHLRAASEKTFVNHFGNEIVDELFERTVGRKLEFARMVDSSKVGFNGMLLAVLKNK